MAAFAGVLGLAAGLACDPDRATNPLHQVGAHANLANPDSVSVVNLCGPRMSIRNANDDSIAVVNYSTTTGPGETIMLPRRPTGEPFGETFIVIGPTQAAAAVGLATRTIFTPRGPACPVRAVVPALPPTTIDSATYVQGKSYWTTDPSVTARIMSSRRLWVAFTESTSQEVREAVIDAIGGTVLGGQIFMGHRAQGEYYVDISASPDSGLKPIYRAMRSLHRNSAVVTVIADSPLDIGPQGVAPKDGAGFTTWLFGRFNIGDANWALEAISAPLAWGCQTGNSSAMIALVDVGTVRVRDVLPNLDSQSSPDSSGDHAAQMASVIGARGNNDSGTVGVSWAPKLRYFNVGQLPPTSAVTVNPAYRNRAFSETMANALWAVAEGYRVVNLSLGYNWLTNTLPPIVPTDTNVQWAYFEDIKQIRANMKRFLQDVDSTIAKHHLAHPLFVFSAGNEGTDAVWNGLLAVKGVLNPSVPAEQAMLNEMIVVGGATQTQSMSTLAWFSNHGALLDVAAPGENVPVVYADHTVQSKSGSSISAAMVSGVAALLLSANPSLDGPALKEAILAGAAAGAYSTANPGGSPLKVVDVYQSLRRLATRPRGPLCGNRVWADANRILVKRDTMPASIAGETIVTASKPIKSVSTYHGGSKLRAWYTDGSSEMFLLDTGTWAAGVAAPESLQTSITGAAFSQFAYSHGGDTLLTTSIMPNEHRCAAGPYSAQPNDLGNPVSTSAALGRRRTDRDSTGIHG